MIYNIKIAGPSREISAPYENDVHPELQDERTETVEAENGKGEEEGGNKEGEKSIPSKSKKKKPRWSREQKSLRNEGSSQNGWRD